MNSQLYTAASGLVVQQRRLEVLANNLANVSTSGFRAQRTFTSVWRGAMGGDESMANHGVALAGSYELPGPVERRPTGRALDISFPDDQMLSVQTAQGRRYSHAGSLDVSAEGELVDLAGRPVLDASGSPIGGLSERARIESDGRVMIDDTEVGRIQVVRDSERVLQPQGDGLYAPHGDERLLETVDEPALASGWLEESGTDALGELVELIEAQRAFESYQKLINMTMNEVNRKAINELAG